ncbi:MAG: aminopeptidase P family N-terminal domain-containing protein, partial [Sphingopyxis sp.]|nr:aminopeptidase P family N-terminal domain-containing protein [Sphingopyxis sp.]
MSTETLNRPATSATAERLASLRAELARQGLDGFIVPISDEHMSEYVGAYAQRLQWLTGFNGSAGTAAVLTQRAAIAIDGRYEIQVRDQVPGDLYDYVDIPGATLSEWLAGAAHEGARIGYDPWLHGEPWVKAMAKALKPAGAQMVPVTVNPVDAVWADQPAPSDAPAIVQTDALAGRTSAEKRAEIAEWLKAKKLDATVVTALDSIAWLFNIRGTDVSRTPVVLSFALLHADGTADLFVDEAKLTAEV